MPDNNGLHATLMALVVRILIASLAVLATGLQARPFTAFASKLSTSISDLPRYEKLPLFNPHRKTFTCAYQAQHLPTIDPQAEVRFQQALALDDPNIYPDKRDYPKIYQLYSQAAERNHWKAMLNLASLILSDFATAAYVTFCAFKCRLRLSTTAATSAIFPPCQCRSGGVI